MSGKLFNKSTAMLKKAKNVIPCASQTYSKSYKYFCEGAAPAFMDKGRGAYVWDVDGNRYIDFVLGLGAITIGYNNPEVNKAVIKQLKKGISFSQPTFLEVELADKLIDLIPCAEMVRFVKNGSDATSAAIRLARAFTGKDMILCSGYHGWHDWYVGSTENDLGVPICVKDMTKHFIYNDICFLEGLLKKYKGKIACVIMEPVSGDGPEKGYLLQVKSLVHKYGALLIFDEVVSGFRMGISGAQGYYNVIPDLASFGKGMANGLALSAVVGRKDIMRLIENGAFISTTFGGESLSLAGALAAINILEKKGVYEHIWDMGNLWKQKMQALIDKKDMNNIVRVGGLAPHCGLIFNKTGKLSNYDLASVFQQYVISKGILTIGINNFCLSHTKEDIEAFIYFSDKAFDEALKAVAKDSVKDILKGGKIMPVFKR